MKKIQNIVSTCLLGSALFFSILTSGCGPKNDGVTAMDSTKSSVPPPKIPDNPNLPPEAKAGIQQRIQQQGAAQQAGRSSQPRPK